MNRHKTQTSLSLSRGQNPDCSQPMAATPGAVVVTGDQHHLQPHLRSSLSLSAPSQHRCSTVVDRCEPPWTTTLSLSLISVLCSPSQMESSKSLSFFQDIRSREVNGFRVRKRPYPDNDLSKFTQTRAVVVEHNSDHRPPMALSFCKTSDHSIKVWDALEKKCIATMLGHRGSVKSICSHPTNPDLVVSGARDGSFMLWDLRCSRGRNGKLFVTSPDEVREAHISPHGRRGRHCKAASVSITSALYLKDEISVATAGAVDNVVKFWDIRNLKGPVIQACPSHELSTEKEKDCIAYLACHKI